VVRKPGRLPSAPTAPPWLAEVVRPAPAPVPWPAVIRAALAVCGPLALGLALGDQLAGLLGAMGGLLGTVVDRGGTVEAMAAHHPGMQTVEVPDQGHVPAFESDLIATVAQFVAACDGAILPR